MGWNAVALGRKLARMYSGFRCLLCRFCRILAGVGPALVRWLAIYFAHILDRYIYCLFIVWIRRPNVVWSEDKRTEPCDMNQSISGASENKYEIPNDIMHRPGLYRRCVWVCERMLGASVSRRRIGCDLVINYARSIQVDLGVGVREFAENSIFATRHLVRLWYSQGVKDLQVAYRYFDCSAACSWKDFLESWHEMFSSHRNAEAKIIKI